MLTLPPRGAFSVPSVVGPLAAGTSAVGSVVALMFGAVIVKVDVEADHMFLQIAQQATVVLT
jgi:hypothetical protein